MLEILIPQSQLFDMFNDGVRMMKAGTGEERPRSGKHPTKNGNDMHRGGSICEF